MKHKLVDLKPEIENLWKKHERHFLFDEVLADDPPGEKGTPFTRESRQQYWLIHSHLLSDVEVLDAEETEELRNKIANKLAVGAKTAGEKDWWWSAPTPAVEDFLRDVQRLLDRAAPNKKERWKLWLRYSWQVITELIYLGLVVSALSVARTKFETVALAILVLTYNAATSTRSGVGFTLAYVMAALQQAYGEIGRSMRLRIPIGPEREAEKTVTKAGITLFIHGASIGLGSLFAIWEIVDAVFFMM